MKNKIQLEKMDDGTCVISIIGKNKHGQPFIIQDNLQHAVYEAIEQLLTPDKPEPDDTTIDCGYDFEFEEEPDKMDAEEWQLTKLRQILIRVFHHEMEGNMLEDYVQDIHQQYANHIKPEPDPSHCACSERQKHGETSVMCCNECGKPTEKFWSRG